LQNNNNSYQDEIQQFANNTELKV